AETDIEVMLLLDASRSMAWRWEDQVSKLEYAATLLAALTFLYMRQHDQVGLMVHDAEDLHYLPPRCRRAQIEEIYVTLDGVQPGAADTFTQLVKDVAERKRHRGHILICSDLEENDEQIEVALKTLSVREDEVMIIHLLDQAEIELPFADATHIRDSETGEVVPVNLVELKKSHREKIDRFRDHWSKLCRQYGMTYVPLDTGMNYIDAIQGYVEAREE
ncbi:MAG: DUF58 domain-containing protein, partial [Verrucomicrobiota bacterium]